MKKVNFILVALLMGIAGTLTLTSCQKEGCTDPNANNYDPDAKNSDGSCLYPHIVPSVIKDGVYYVTSNGGSISESHTWNNSDIEAEYEIEFLEEEFGSIQVIILDANGKEVANETMLVGEDITPIEDCTLTGVAGTWTVTITISEFFGEASIALFEGCN